MLTFLKYLWCRLAHGDDPIFYHPRKGWCCDRCERPVDIWRETDEY